jgi:hypothetical protein
LRGTTTGGARNPGWGAGGKGAERARTKKYCLRRKSMSLEIETALISAFVALITTAIGGFLTWYQIQRERRKWLIDLTTSYALELYKKRLENYPKVHLILANLSKHAPEPLTPEKAK